MINMKFAVVCAAGIGDALILHIVSHHLRKAGHEVTTVTPHRFGRWLSDYQFGDGEGCDAVFLQHDNSLASKRFHAMQKPVYTFYGSHLLEKHGPLRTGFDYVCDPNRTMVDNVVTALRLLFRIPATDENGFKPFPSLIHRRHKKRVAIHTSSAVPEKNWPEQRFLQLARWLESEGYEPAILPLFPTLEDLASYIYESGYFLGNDSGPGHIASCLKIPHLIIGREEKQMKLWRPGWATGEVVVPPSWLPNWKGLRLREAHWKKFVTLNNVIKRFKNNVLCN
jgi:heptosyltransferase-3